MKSTLYVLIILMYLAISGLPIRIQIFKSEVTQVECIKNIPSAIVQSSLHLGDYTGSTSEKLI